MLSPAKPAGFFHRSQVTGHQKKMPKRHETDAYKCVLSVTIAALFWKKKRIWEITYSTEIKKKIDPTKAKTYFCWKHKLFVAFQYNMKTKEAYTDVDSEPGGPRI